LIQTFLLDGTMEGVRIIDCESSVMAFAIPRLRLGDIKNREELSYPALYFLISLSDNRVYVGESENFYHRIKNHDQNKDWWDLAVAIISATNSLEKSDVKYLESLAVERAQDGSSTIENKVAPIRNNIHEFKLHKLQQILDDTQLILTSLGYDVLSKPEQNQEQTWYLKTKKATAQGVYRGDQFIVLKDSTTNTDRSEKWAAAFPKIDVLRISILKDKAAIVDGNATLTENVAFKSVSLAAGFITGNFINGWHAWKNEQGQTMDEVVRKAQ
jgi:hypothetical protein